MAKKLKPGKIVAEILPKELEEEPGLKFIKANDPPGKIRQWFPPDKESKDSEGEGSD